MSNIVPFPLAHKARIHNEKLLMIGEKTHVECPHCYTEDPSAPRGTRLKRAWHPKEFFIQIRIIGPDAFVEDIVCQNRWEEIKCSYLRA